MKAEFWRSVEEYAASKEVEELVHREFPALASEFTDPVGRRRFLQLMGASLALAGAGACTRQPDESIVPYVRQPEEIIPGRPLYFATAIPEAGVAMPVIVESHMGRPTKIEGNPEHPASLGATDARTQAAILTLYDPDRAQTITYRGDVRPWGGFLGGDATRDDGAARETRGRAADPHRDDHVPDARRSAFSAPPGAAGCEVAPMGACGSCRRHARSFSTTSTRRTSSCRSTLIFSAAGRATCGTRATSRARRKAGGDRPPLRLYAVESCPTITGAKADHRLPLRAVRDGGVLWSDLRGRS